MNWDLKDFIIATTLGLMCILSTFTLVDWFIEKDSAIGVGVAIGFIGAILGGVISGLLTLFGVKLTMESSTKQVNNTLLEQQRLREEELINNAIKDRLLLLYNPLYTLINVNHFKYGAHDFENLTKEEQLDIINIIAKNEIYADEELYIKILEINWAYKEKDYVWINQLYREMGDIVTDTISIMKDQLKLPKREL
ncbi:MAG: hypothetical protein ABS917_05365 [Solibacillus sp.]|uniref:hypothetical protein n=1 Tax=Solibacillus sp. TaxID=1909654 RepID=UPI0033158453